MMTTPSTPPAALVWRNRALAPIALATMIAGLGFYVPVSALFLQGRGLSLGDIFLLESILVASILVAEVPAGLISDRIDRRWVVMSGFVLHAIAEILFAGGTTFFMFAMSFMVSGFGIAMLTGAQDAYIYDSMGEDADSQSVGVWGHLSALQLISGVIGAIIGGYLASIDISWPALAAAITAAAAAVVAFFIPSQRPVQDADADAETAFAALGIGIRLLFTSPILLYVAVASSASFVLFNSAFTLNQPLFEGTQIPVALWGVIGALAQLCAAGYNHFAGSIEKRIGRKYALLFAMGYGAGGFFLMATPHPVAVVFGFVLVVLGMNARGPITMAVANRVIPRARRATVLNVASSVGSIVGIVVNPLIGWGADASPALTVIAIGAVLLVMMLTWIPVANRFLPGPGEEDHEEDRPVPEDAGEAP